MARFSKQDVTPNQDGPGTEWRQDLDGYTVSMVSVEAHMGRRAQELFGATSR